MTALREALLRRLAPILACPDCRQPLESLACARCHKQVRVADRFDFGGLSLEEEKADWLNAVKGQVKRRFGRVYPLLIEILSPIYHEAGFGKFLESFDLEREIVCDFGAGTRSYGDRVVCVDGYAYENVHVVCDLSRLPFADDSIDGIISEAVLEHVPDPAVHVREMLRVLKPGGRVRCYFPFMQAFHASPHDYSRMTTPGLQHLFGQFDIGETRVASGPTSGLLWTLQEWLALAGSFGNERLYRALVPLTWVLSPLKYVDAALIRHPAAHVIAAGFTIEATKPKASV